VPAREDHASRLARLVKKARRQMTAAMRAALEPLGAPLPAVQILKRAAAGRDLSQLELAQELDLEPAALSRLLADLEARRLVTRRRDPRDRRRMLMAPTAAGVALLARAQPPAVAAVRGLVARLDRSEQADLCRLLEKLTAEP
jgi:DNA-binding MarR family transcriptional regulator